MHDRASLILAMVIMAVSAGAVWMASGWPWKAALFPIVIGVPVFLLALAEAAAVLLGRGEAGEGPEYRMSSEVSATLALRRTWLAAGWMGAFLATIVLVGFPYAIPAFVVLYMRLQGGESWPLSIMAGAAVWGFFYGVFDRLLHLPFPNGWIQGWLGF